MGFETQNTNTSSKPVTYLNIVTEKEGEKVIGKFFQASKKVDGKYEKELLKNSYNYPLPFFGYLTGITPKLDNTFKQAGVDRPAPKIAFSFVDDKGDNYVLDIPFCNDKGRVSGFATTLLNSLASIKQFGLLKIYITSTDQKDKVTKQPIPDLKNYTINVRNDVNWNPATADFKRFLAPEKDAEGKNLTPDTTKVSWKYDYKDITSYDFTENVRGKDMIILNVEEHQKWFVNLIENEILPILKGAVYPEAKTVATTSTTGTKSNVPKSTIEQDIPEDDDLDTATVNLEDTTGADDLPF
jgi:hypothetical protein